MYRALLVCLPRGLRERHGAAMLDLYARELARQGGAPLGVSRAAVAGMADLLARGVVERVAEERRFLVHGGWGAMGTLGKGIGIAFFTLTALLLLNYTQRHLPGLSAGRGAALVLYAVPCTIALTIPAALFVGVLWGLTRAGAVDPGVPPQTPSVRPLPLAVGAAAVALLAFGLTAEVVPRANARLVGVLTGRTATLPTDRTMTLAALRAEARRLDAVQATRRDPRMQASRANLRGEIHRAHLRVEIHKKFALPAACVLLTLLAAGLARRAPQASGVTIAMASAAVFGGYYLLLMGGETLADQSVVPPALAMWSANFVVLGLAAMTLRATPRGMDAAQLPAMPRR
jgi:hypothetical protein